MKRTLYLVLLVLFTLVSIKTGFSKELIGDGTGDLELLPRPPAPATTPSTNFTAPIIENVKSYEFMSSAGEHAIVHIPVVAKDPDGSNLTLAINTSSLYGSSVSPVVQGPGYASAIIHVDLQYLVGDFPIVVTAADGDPRHTTSVILPVKIVPQGDPVDLPVSFNNFSHYIRVVKGESYTLGVMLNDNTQFGSILSTGADLCSASDSMHPAPVLCYVDRTLEFPDAPLRGELMINPPAGAPNAKFEVTLRGEDGGPDQHFVEEKIIVEFVDP